MSYHEVCVAEHATIQIGLLNRFSLHRIARLLNRSPSTMKQVLYTFLVGAIRHLGLGGK